VVHSCYSALGFRVEYVFSSFHHGLILTSSLLALIFSPLSDLRAAFSRTDKSEPFIPQRVLVIQQTPVIVKFASNDTRMVLGLASGLIQLYDTSVLFTPGSTHVQPIHSWPSVPNSLRHILPNPGEMPDQVAILREANAPIAVEIFDVQKLESIGGWCSSNVPESTPTSRESPIILRLSLLNP
jgi:nucleoporin NUP159